MYEYKIKFLALSDTISFDIKSNEIEIREEFIKDFSKTISNIMYENKYFSDSFKKLDKGISEFKNYELFHSFLKMRNFRLLTGTQWLIKI